MASIDITTQSGAVGNGDLQLQNGAPMDSTLRFVTDALNTASPLKLSTSLVQTTSTLKITTNDNPYIDAEDGSGNNRFTIGRDPASQQVNVDFASNPTGSTTTVGAIRTYVDGVNLSEVMTFREDGNVGIGTNAPDAKLNIVGGSQCNLRVESTIAGGGIDLKDSTTTADNQVGIGAFGDDLCFRSGGAAAGNMRLLANGNLGIGTTAPTKALTINANVNDDGFLLRGATSSAIFQVTKDGASNNTCELFAYSGGVVNFAIRATSNTSYFNNGTFSFGATTNLGGKVNIKGSGSTSATTALLVQNSAGTDLFKISDNANFTFSAGGTADFFGNLSLRGIVDSGNAANNLRFIVPGATKSVLINADYSNSNAPSAMLEVQSTTKGFLPPRMTTAQKNAIATPAAGLMVYDTTLNKLCVYTTAWETITSI